MRVSYNKLWKLLIDKKMTHTDLRLAVGASTSTFAKLSKDEYISCDLMARICKALDCDIGDIMEFVRSDAADETEKRH